MFWKRNNDTGKNVINSDEYERLVKRFTEVASDIGILKSKYQTLETELANLRGKFNAKLKGIKETEQEEKKEVETFNNDGYVAFG